MKEKVRSAAAWAFLLWMTSVPLACENTYIHGGTKAPGLRPALREVVCVDVSDSQVRPVLEAIDAWDEAISNWKRLVPRLGKSLDGCDYVIVEVEPPAGENPRTLATTSSLFGRLIKLYRGRYEIDARSVVLHEIGHALGARHMPDTMMNPQIAYNIYKCPDAATIAQVAVANDLDPTTLSWCVTPR